MSWPGLEAFRRDLLVFFEDSKALQFGLWETGLVD